MFHGNENTEHKFQSPTAHPFSPVTVSSQTGGRFVRANSSLAGRSVAGEDFSCCALGGLNHADKQGRLERYGGTAAGRQAVQMWNAGIVFDMRDDIEIFIDLPALPARPGSLLRVVR